MQVELQPHTIDLLERASTMLKASNYDEVIVKAVSETLEQARHSSSEGNGRTAEEIIEGFRSLRGMLRGVTIEEIVAMKHEGLA